MSLMKHELLNVDCQFGGGDLLSLTHDNPVPGPELFIECVVARPTMTDQHGKPDHTEAMINLSETDALALAASITAYYDERKWETGE